MTLHRIPEGTLIRILEVSVGHHLRRSLSQLGIQIGDVVHVQRHVPYGGPSSSSTGVLRLPWAEPGQKNPRRARGLRIALVGQPNCGKSTLFNSVAGYRSITANFPGVTVHYTRSRIQLHGETAELIDLPGTYSLTASTPAESATRDFLS